MEPNPLIVSALTGLFAGDPRFVLSAILTRGSELVAAAYAVVFVFVLVYVAVFVAGTAALAAELGIPVQGHCRGAASSNE